MAGFIRKLQHGAANKSEEDTENEGQRSNKRRYEHFHKANQHFNGNECIPNETETYNNYLNRGESSEEEIHYARIKLTENKERSEEGSDSTIIREIKQRHKLFRRRVEQKQDRRRKIKEKIYEVKIEKFKGGREEPNTTVITSRKEKGRTLILELS